MSDQEKNLCAGGSLTTTTTDEASSNSTPAESLQDPWAGFTPNERAQLVSKSTPIGYRSLPDRFQERKLLWRLDLQLMPWVCLIPHEAVRTTDNPSCASSI